MTANPLNLRLLTFSDPKMMANPWNLMFLMFSDAKTTANPWHVQFLSFSDPAMTTNPRNFFSIQSKFKENQWNPKKSKEIQWNPRNSNEIQWNPRVLGLGARALSNQPISVLSDTSNSLSSSASELGLCVFFRVPAEEISSSEDFLSTHGHVRETLEALALETDDRSSLRCLCYHPYSKA